GQRVAEVLTRFIPFIQVPGHFLLACHIDYCRGVRGLDVSLLSFPLASPAKNVLAALCMATRPTIPRIAKPRRFLSPPPVRNPAAAAIAKAVIGVSFTYSPT